MQSEEWTERPGRRRDDSFARSDSPVPLYSLIRAQRGIIGNK